MGKVITVKNPYNGDVLGEVEETDAAALEAVFKRAHAAFADRDAWLQPYERIEILKKAARLMTDRREDLAKIAASEGGKPWNDTLIEVDRAIEGVQLCVHHLHSMAGREIPMGLNPASAGHLAFTRHEPVGVVFSASAFNHPLNLAVHQIAPAVAVGAPVIFKPAAATPLSGKKLIEIFHESGLDQQWCQYVLTSNELTAQAVSDSRLGFFSFIGSARVGEMLRRKVAPGVESALEHGGAAAVIFEADADWQAALPGLIKGAFYHAGQVCVSVQRLFAHESIAKKLAQAIADRAKKLVVGDPLQAETEVGPLISEAVVNKVDEWVREAEAAGAEILAGGKKIGERSYAPTVVYAPNNSVKLSREEIFGPVVAVYPYKDRRQAIEQANSLPYAFQAAVYTQDLDAALDTSKRLKATVAMINEHTAFRVDWMPFGGYEQSGVRLGGIPYSMRDMSREKMIVIKSPAL